MRYSIKALIFVMLLLSGVTKIVAQQKSDFKIRTEIKHSTCKQNGEVTIYVDNISGKDIKYEVVDCNLYNEEEKSQTNMKDEVTNNKFGNLLPGKYTAKASVKLDDENKLIELVPVECVVLNQASKFKTSVFCVRKNLPDYKPKGNSQIYTGIISILTPKDGKEYEINIKGYPKEYTGVKHLKLPGITMDKDKDKDKNKEEPDPHETIIYGCPPGEYTIVVSNECNDATMKVSVEDLPKGYCPGGEELMVSKSNPYLEQKMELRQDSCGYVTFKLGACENDPSKYLSNLDAIAEYYDYAIIQGDREPKIEDFKPFPKGTAINRVESPTVHSIRRISSSYFQVTYALSNMDFENKKSQYKTFDDYKKEDLPWVYIKLKGQSNWCKDPNHLTKRATFEAKMIDKTMVPHPCFKSGELRITANKRDRAIFCFPLTITVEKDGKKTDEKKLVDYNEISISMEKGHEYNIIVTDNLGQKEVHRESLNKIGYNLTKSVNTHYTPCESIVITAKAYLSQNYSKDGYIDGHIETNFQGSRFRIREAPEDYKPKDLEEKEKYAEVGEIYDFEGKLGDYICFLSKNGTDRYLEWKYPTKGGTFVFELFSPCNETDTPNKTFTMDVEGVKETIYHPENFKPVFKKIDCQHIRLYPFKKSGTLVTYGGKEMPRALKLIVDKKTHEHTKVNIPKDKQNDYYNYGYISEELVDPKSTDPEVAKKPEDIYIEFQNYDATVKFQLITERYSSEFCDTYVPVELKNLNLTYDRDRYFAYSCPDRKTGQMRICPINNVGPVKLSLFHDETEANNGKKPIAESEVAEDGGCALFNLGEAENGQRDIQNSYFLKMEDQCKNGSKDNITVYNIAPSIVFVNHGENRLVCQGDKITLSTVKLGDDDGDDKVKYIWICPNREETYSGREIVIKNADVSKHSGQYTLRIENIKCRGEEKLAEINFEVYVAPDELWWKEDAKDSDWHNSENWEDKNGEKTKGIPSHCTNVHIPSTTKFFPDLYAYENGTRWEKFGTPSCNNIYFHYGAKLHGPHLLKYVNAYVDYNFGYYDDEGNLVSNKITHHESADQLKMSRNRWYMLAVPLKGVYSGDFDLAGKPFIFSRSIKEIWNGKLEAVNFNNIYSKLNHQITKLKLYTNPFYPIERLLGYQSFNAIALKAAGYMDKTGYKNQDNLNTLKGIIRIPYCEDEDRKAAYPLHRYIKEKQESILYYYDFKTLKPINKSETLERSPLNYRFVFETNDNAPEEITFTAKGSTITNLGYEMAYDTSKKWMMVGNPFMTDINFNNFVQVNPSIYPYYYIYSDEKWLGYSSEAQLSEGAERLHSDGEIISPLQAILVRCNQAGKEAKLIFPIEGDYNILIKPGKLVPRSTSTSIDQQKVTPMHLRLSNSTNQFYDAYIAWGRKGSSMPAIVSPESEDLPIVYVSSSDGRENNMLNFDEELQDYYNIGISSSLMGEMTLRFDHYEDKNLECLKLIDKQSNKVIDLMTTPEYRFMHNPLQNEGNRFMLVCNKDLPLTIGKVEDDCFKISDRGDALVIDSDKSILRVDLYGMSGELLYSKSGISDRKATIPHPAGTQEVMLRVVLEDCTTKSLPIKLR
ncbi:hypothetical protein [Falsiporphyromonas endometrii]|uniref:Uncharacterized protein n=1 Tax=Falsiporphyromonas endometrii TaxID=1387297 RepID=A0ABV9K6H3_9PORP